MQNFIIVTANEVAGYKITEVYGEVFGLTTRSRNAFSSMGQNLKTVVGGEIAGYTKLQHETREKAISRMIEEAIAKGANAVIAMRFDSSTFANIDSVAAYGTAVKIEGI
ncbi:heavy metal-binding domain-containing protein [Lactococcus lactis]|uniref:heavy metal-binding domain-containing protein n=1 Tax=Lactococcus lactis TaxID=1358 RepID=UPI00398E435D